VLDARVVAHPYVTMSNRRFSLGSLFSLCVWLVVPVTGCDTGEGTACASAAECAAGQTCSAGSCVPAQGQAGSAGAGVGGMGPTAGANAAGGNPNGVAGSGGVATGGAPTAGANAGGLSNTAGSAGQSTTGGVPNGGSAGQAGAGGSGGSGGAPIDTTPTIGECKDDYWPAANNGSVTRYDFKQGTSLPACAHVITHTGNGSDGDWDTVEGISTGDGGYFGAMNTEDYANGAVCGACVEASYNGRKVVLTIVDECPKSTNPVCNKGHIDLSRKAIRQLEPNGSLENLKGVSWRYVKCPANGNVKARIHPSQNANWQPVVIENGLFPLKTVTLNGVAAKRVGNNTGGNAWEAAGQKPPYAVRATDVNGNAISFNVTAGTNLQDAGQQFMCK
jgi:expansin (peptidoglycan-binding protein)